MDKLCTNLTYRNSNEDPKKLTDDFLEAMKKTCRKNKVNTGYCIMHNGDGYDNIVLAEHIDKDKW